MSKELEILNEIEAMKTRTLKPVREVPRNVRFWRKADIRAQTETLQGESVATMAPAFRADTCSTRIGHRQFPIHPTDITSVFSQNDGHCQERSYLLVIALSRRSMRLVLAGLDCSVEFVILGMTAR